MLDLDGGLVGRAPLDSATASPLGVTAAASSDSLASFSADVAAGRIHAALVVQPGATAAFTDALAAPARGLGADVVSFVYDEGREGPLAVGTLLSAMSNTLTAATVQAERQLRNCSGKPPSLGATVAAVHPVKSFGENNAAGDSLIIAWVLMAEVMGDMLTLYGSWEQAGVRRDHQVAAQCAHLAAAAVFIALGPPIVLQGLGAQLKASKFVALWAWFVLVLNAFGILITTLFTAGLSPLLVGKVHLLLLLINLVSSGGLVPAPMLPPFYNIRLGLPFGHAVSGARTILFGSRNRLRTNAAVLAAWTAACYCMAARRAWLARSQLRAAQATAPDGADMF